MSNTHTLNQEGNKHKNIYTIIMVLIYLQDFTTEHICGFLDVHIHEECHPLLSIVDYFTKCHVTGTYHQGLPTALSSVDFKYSGE